MGTFYDDGFEAFLDKNLFWDILKKLGYKLKK